MLCASALAAMLGLVGCNDDQVTTPQQIAVVKEPRSLIVAASFGPDSVQVVNYCATQFHIRSAHDTAYTVKWKRGTATSISDSGIVVLPPRAPGSLFSSTLLVQPAATPPKALLAYRTTGQYISGANDGSECPEIPAAVVNETPNSVREAIYAPGNLLGPAQGFAGTATKNTVWVRFKESVTSADRRAAIDSIQGELVGGSNFIRSHLVRFPLNGDSSSRAPLHRAVDKLKSLSQVYDVRYDWTDMGIAPTHLRPNDGALFSMWRLNPATADSANWGPEAVAGPLAWDA